MNKDQQELLELITEECSEVIKAISKAKRFGLHDSHKGKTNLQEIQQEVGDVITLVLIFGAKYPELMNASVIESAINVKFKRLQKYIPHLLKNITLKDILS